MGYKLNIHTGSSWINVLKDANIEITDVNGYFTATDLESLLDELYLEKAGVTTSTSDPSSSDDSYEIGTIWVNTSSDVIFICTDNTSSNAIWNMMGSMTTLSINSSTSLSEGNRYIVDSSAGSLTMTLPSTPSAGDRIEFTPASDWSTNNFTVARNGSNIQGVTTNFTVDVKYGLEFTYSNSTWGWGIS